MAASIGEQLRLAREARGIGLREICDQTRISIHYLEAIEANDYKRLPGGVFNRSFIKAYAKSVGYDEREAIEGYTRYLREHGDQASDEVNTTPMHSKVYTDLDSGDPDRGRARGALLVSTPRKKRDSQQRTVFGAESNSHSYV
jgi:transcriptional regulator with XRE-family HTH domain